MKTILLLLSILILPIIGISQPNAQDTILQNQAHWLNFECYQDNYQTVFFNYSNGQESCIFYNLQEKDSIVKYYYSGEIASIGLYFGCKQDTIWTTIYKSYKRGDNVNLRNMAVGEIYNRADYFITIDSIEYQYYTHYELRYTPIYELTLFDERGKIMGREWNNRSAFIDFKEIMRDKYSVPE